MFFAIILLVVVIPISILSSVIGIVNLVLRSCTDDRMWKFPEKDVVATTHEKSVSYFEIELVRCKRHIVYLTNHGAYHCIGEKSWSC